MSNIRKVIEHYTGEFSGVKCCCPIHGEKTPSFQLYEETESWHCFGECSTGGDAIDFIKAVEECNFPQAVKIYEELTGDTQKYLRINMEDVVGLPFDKEVNEKIKADTITDGKGYRGIRKDTSAQHLTFSPFP